MLATSITVSGQGDPETQLKLAAGTFTDPGHIGSETQDGVAGVHVSSESSGQGGSETHLHVAALSGQSVQEGSSNNHVETQSRNAVSSCTISSQEGDGRGDTETQRGLAAPSCDPRQLAELRLWAATYEAASKELQSAKQRFHSTDNLTQHITGGDIQIDLADQAKKHARKMLFASYKRAFPAIYAWAKGVPGFASSSDLAWLLAIIGDPGAKTPHTRMTEAPEGHECSTKCGAKGHLVALETSWRSVGQLWQYCGHGAAVKRTKGMSAEDAMSGGSTQAKTLVHRLAESCMKMQGGVTATGVDRKRSPYRDVYDAARLAKEGREDWSDAHKHNHALRITAKEILRDLWIVSNETRAQ